MRLRLRNPPPVVAAPPPRVRVLLPETVFAPAFTASRPAPDAPPADTPPPLAPRSTPGRDGCPGCPDPWAFGHAACRTRWDGGEPRHMACGGGCAACGCECHEEAG